jgi:hypothetical protein
MAVAVADKPLRQVTVRVLDLMGRPLPEAVVRIYRTLPFSYVGESKTDAEGKAYFDGLWGWAYVLAADHEPGKLTTPPAHFTVTPNVPFSFELVASPPPYLYEMRIQCGLVPAAIREWVVKNVSLIENTIITHPNHKFVDAWAEDSLLFIRFRVTAPPFPWAAIGAILAILALLAIIGWEIEEIIEIPEFL